MKVGAPSKIGSLYKILEERILSGVWPVGSLIPTEVEFAAEFSCNRATVGKAIVGLVHEGLVERRKRSGTRVIRNTKNPNLPPVKLDAFAFIYPSDKSEGCWRMVKGFQDVGTEEGRPVVLLSAGADSKKAIEFIARLSEFDVRGAVICPFLATKEDQILFSQILLNIKFPVVLAESNVLGVDRPSVTIDGFHAGYTMTRHLLGRGCRNIGFLADYTRIPSVRDKYMGYRLALEEAGLQEEPQRVLLESGMKPNFSDPHLESVNLAKRFFERCNKVDGIVASTDFLATGLLKVAAESGIKVPKDLKITGMDDLDYPRAERKILTTYHVPFEKIGAMAFTTLESLISEELDSPSETLVRGSLVVRESA